MQRFLVLALVGVTACTASGSAEDAGSLPPPDATLFPDANQAADAIVLPDAEAPDAGESLADSGTPDGGGENLSVVVSYQPQWGGVRAVTLVGAFGLADDWMMPFATLTLNASGAYTATVSLPAGSYPYLFRVAGDEANPARRFSRLAIDPLNPNVAACPVGSPPHNANPTNPCSTLAVPAGAPAQRQVVRGSLVYDASPIAEYLVVIERVEARLHHTFVNRVTAGADGTFALVVVPGRYRLQVLHPTIYQQDDAARDGLRLQAIRRLISTPFDVSNADLAIAPAGQTAFHGYSAMRPVSGSTDLALPVTLRWTRETGAPSSYAALYAVNSTTTPNVGDPSYRSTTSATATTALFDGHFNVGTTTAAVMPGRVYYWGTEQLGPAATTDPGSVQWSAQSMVFSISFR